MNTVHNASFGPSDPLLARIAEQLLERDVDKRPSWHDDPVAFAEQCIQWPEGQRLAPYQADVIRSLIAHGRVSVRGPHGLGKSTMAALLVLWFALGRDLAGESWKVMTTAGSWRQLTAFLWPEINLWSRRIRWDVIGRPPFDQRTEAMQTMLRLRHGQAFAGASDDPALLEGMHADHVLLVLDESKAIPATTWEAVEGALSGVGVAYAFAVSTPGVPTGIFHAIHQRRPGYEDWWARHVTLDEAVAAKRISPTWAAARARQWGESSAVFRNRCLGEFASSDEDSVIPLSWVEAATDRWQERASSADSSGPLTIVGVDVARGGTDQTVLALRHGDVVTELRRVSHADTMQTAGRVLAVLQANPGSRAVVDVIGVGSGVVDRVREEGHRRTVAFNASAGTQRKDRSGELGFVNTRSAAWWWLREQLDPAFDPALALPPDDLLIGDLTAPRYSITSTGKIAVEGKDDIRKRLGRSTDSADAVVVACFDTAPGLGAGWLEFFKAEAARQQAEAPRVPPELKRRGYLLGEAPPHVVHPRECFEHRYFAQPDSSYRCVYCGAAPPE